MSSPIFFYGLAIMRHDIAIPCPDIIVSHAGPHEFRRNDGRNAHLEAVSGENPDRHPVEDERIQIVNFDSREIEELQALAEPFD